MLGRPRVVKRRDEINVKHEKIGNLLIRSQADFSSLQSNFQNHVWCKSESEISKFELRHSHHRASLPYYSTFSSDFVFPLQLSVINQPEFFGDFWVQNYMKK